MYGTAENPISELIDFLQNDRRKIYHACQLADFHSYIELGGIPSRKYLIESGLRYTRFFSDDSDKKIGVDSNFFGNLGDFGHWFAYLAKGTPCPYGPVNLVLKPSVLTEAKEIWITKVSASNKEYDKDAMCLSIAELGEMYQKDKYASFLKAGVPTPEINMSMNGLFVPLHYIETIIVDPFGKGSLVDNVLATVQKAGIDSNKVRQRKCKDINQFDCLWIALLRNGPDFDAIAADTGTVENIREWAKKCSASKNIAQQLKIFWSNFQASTSEFLKAPGNFGGQLQKNA